MTPKLKLVLKATKLIQPKKEDLNTLIKMLQIKESSLSQIVLNLFIKSALLTI